MSADWTEVPLTDIYDISSGLSKPADSFGSGYPFLSFKEVFGNYFLPDILAQLVESTENERIKGSIKRGDVFLTRTSETMHELGMSSIALKDYPEATFNGFTKRLRPKENTSYEILPEYIGYYLRSPKFRRSMLAFSTMSTRASLNNDMISRLKIKVPPINIQRNIAKTLKALDDKIQLNRQTNQTLEQIAQAIFKSWFVDFEPTRAKIAAKAAGQDPERAAMAAISGKTIDKLDTLNQDQLEQLKTTAALFPDALTDSELGEIPEGWTVDYLNEVAEITYGKNLPTKKLLEDGYPVFGGNGIIGFFNTFLYENPMTLVACRGAASGKVLRSLPKSFVTNNSLVINHEKKGYLTQHYVEPCLARYGLQELTSGSAQPQMTIANMNPVQIIMPHENIIKRHEKMVKPLFNKILQNRNEINLLEISRDTLLPKLLSGELSTEAKKS